MSTPSWFRTTVAVVLLALAVMAAATRKWRNQVMIGDPTQMQGRDGFCDFRDGVYYATLAFVSGENPNDVDVYLRKYPVNDRAPLYSPSMYLMYAPFTLLPFMSAALVHFALSVAGSRFGEPVLFAASSVNGLAILAVFAVYVTLAWRMP
jgi:hypothetical protein